MVNNKKGASFQRQPVVRQAEYIYKIEAPDRVLINIRHIYKTTGQKCPKAKTGILHTVVGSVDSNSFNYRDSDGKSKNADPIKYGADKEIAFLSQKEEIRGKEIVKFGLVNLETDLNENDIYWIEIEALHKNLVKIEGDSCKLPLSFINEEKDTVIFQIRVPFASEGIFRHKQTIIQSVVPSPSTVYNELGCKVFQWNLGRRLAGERDRFDVIYNVKSTYTPLIKYLVSGFIGAVMGVLIGALLVLISTPPA